MFSCSACSRLLLAFHKWQKLNTSITYIRFLQQPWRSSPILVTGLFLLSFLSLSSKHGSESRWLTDLHHHVGLSGTYELRQFHDFRIFRLVSVQERKSFQKDSTQESQLKLWDKHTESIQCEDIPRYSDVGLRVPTTDSPFGSDLLIDRDKLSNNQEPSRSWVTARIDMIT